MRLKSVTEESRDIVYDRMKEAFPYEERRDKEDWIKLFDCERYKCMFIVDEKEIQIGFAAWWEYDEFIFLEHLAINGECRGHGYGTEFLNFFRVICNKPIILEVEFPVTEQAIKRIEFYRKADFYLNDKYEYYQPSYHGKESLPLILMSTVPLDEDKVKTFVKTTLASCYKNN